MAKPDRTRLSGPLGQHVFGTYISLRWGLAVASFALPPVLYFFGKLFYGLPLQPSMSAYYFAADATQCSIFPTRPLFVGTMCAIALSLYLYKGFSKLENVLLNLAAVSGVVVAMCPEHLDDVQLKACPGLRDVAAAQEHQLPWHAIAAVAMFVFLAAVAWFCSSQTLAALPAQHQSKAKRFARSYKTFAIGMLTFPLAGTVLNLWLGANSLVFFVELAGVWTFGGYWLVKSLEMNLSEAEFRELSGHT